MKKGKAAAGIDGLTVEHLMYSHPALVSTVLSAVTMLNLSMKCTPWWCSFD